MRYRQDLQALIEKDQDRLDALMSKQTEILDSRLGLSPIKIDDGTKTTKPIGGRKSWSTVKSSYESQEREKYWKDYIQRTEAMDGAMNTPDKGIA